MKQKNREEIELLPPKSEKMSKTMSETRVMVVDDDAFVREILKAKLSSKGLEVIEAANGQDALKKAETEKPCLIVLDIMMPGMNGFDVCERLRANPLTVNVPILFLTSRGDQEDRERAMRLGALDFFMKPFSPQKLSEKILEIVCKS
jgi:DNA-binding response OmpR family regulator